MAKLSFKGITAQLPPGFEGTIYQRQVSGGAVAYPVGQFATFPLPSETGDFGGGATPLMEPNDIFVALFEYGPESVGRTLFDRQGIPRVLYPQYFHPYTLRRGINGQAGTQWFFTESGRPFSLYAVLGSYALRTVLVPKLNSLLVGLEIAAVPERVIG